MSCCCEYPTKLVPQWASVLVHVSATGEILHAFSRSDREGNAGTCGESALGTWVGSNLFAICDYVSGGCNPTPKLYLLNARAEVLTEEDNDEPMLDSIFSGGFVVKASPDGTKVVVVQTSSGFSSTRVLCYECSGASITKLWACGSDATIGQVLQVDVSDDYVLLLHTVTSGSSDPAISQIDISDGSLLWTVEKDTASVAGYGPRGGVIVGSSVYAAWNEPTAHGMRVFDAATGTQTADYVDATSDYVYGTVYIDGFLYMSSTAGELWQYDTDGNLSTVSGMRSIISWMGAIIPYQLSNGNILWRDTSDRAVLIDPSSMTLLSTGTTSDHCRGGWVVDGGYMANAGTHPSSGMRRRDNTMAVDPAYGVRGWLVGGSLGPSLAGSHAGLRATFGGLSLMSSLLGK